MVEPIDWGLAEEEQPAPARGSDANYCSAYPAEGHAMVSLSAGKKIRWVERCQFCGWIDGDALDGWADNAIKESLTARAGRIAVATETEPFAIVQPSSGELDIREILTQGLAAAFSIGLGQGFNDKRMAQILDRLHGEVERYAGAKADDARITARTEEGA